MAFRKSGDGPLLAFGALVKVMVVPERVKSVPCTCNKPFTKSNRMIGAKLIVNTVLMPFCVPAGTSCVHPDPTPLPPAELDIATHSGI